MERGTQSYEGGGVTFVTFSKGKFVQRVSEPNEKTKTRKLTKGPNEGKEVHEMHYDSITGALIDVFAKDGEYGKQWVFRIDASTAIEKKVYQFETGVTFGIGNDILFCLKNMDLTKDVRLSGYQFETEGNRIKEGIIVYQSSASAANGEIAKNGLLKVAKFYTKENPNGLPEWKKVKLNGKDVFDKTDQIIFLENLINEVRSQLKTSTPQPVASSASSTTTQFIADERSSEDVDDLPF